MSHLTSRQSLLSVFVALLLTTVPALAVEVYKVSNYGGGHQIWFEAEAYDVRSPDTDQYYPVVDAADAYGQAVTRTNDSGGMISWTFDIRPAGGKGGTWYFWARLNNPGNSSDYMLVEGDPGDPQIPSGPPYPGGNGTAPFDNADDRIFEETIGPPWAWGLAGHEEGHTKELQNGENTMYVFHRQGDETVFWDVFMWTDDPGYVPTDQDYENAQVPLPGAATNPSPPDEATDVSRDVALSWTPGDYAASTDGHVLYLSDSFDAVENRTVGGITVTDASYDPPGRLDFGQTYFWRVDEIDGPPDFTARPGNVWSFTTELSAYPITNIIATASSSSVDKGPENTINGSGLDAAGLLHGNAGAGTMWLSDIAGPQPTWIMFEFDNVYKLDEMWVWNYNESLEPVIGLGFKDVTVEYSTDGVDFVTLGATHEFAQGSGAADYAHNTTIDFGGLPVKYVRLTANSNWKDLLPQFGLSEIRFFSIPVQASAPSPASGATGVDLNPVLGWKAGREASEHDVYLSEDPNAVADGTAPVTTVTGTSYGPLDLDLGRTYYWRVDEVNDIESPALWLGSLWDFTTIDSLVLDDLESYTDDDAAGQAIWQTWIDGFGVPENGSQVGYLMPPYAEQTIIHGGAQSMPLFYDNAPGAATYSEASRTLQSQRDWTVKGIAQLSIWFRGNPASVGSFTEGPAGTYTMTAAGTDIWDVADEFHFAYKTLNGAGSITAKVESVENTNVWAKAGVMIRETLDPGSKFTAVYITPTNADGTPTQGCRFQGRADTDGAATSDTSVATAEQMTIKAPYWVRIERDTSGNLRGYYSADGANWQPMVWRPSVSMGSTVYVGLALTSHDPALTCTAVFSDVQTTGTVTGQWQSQDIGIASNAAEPLYAVLSNANGTTAVVAHDDPLAATIDTWTQWMIPLQVFADQGINLADVDSLAIGLGSKAGTTTTGGSGTMYFDDIRLYP
ncbi:MAG: discoidin domain-containing protein [Sedimentisphaerales bacterium]